MGESRKAVVLLSGGMDSTTCLAIALKEHGYQPENVLALTAFYGQKHKNEILAAEAVAKHYGVRHETKNLPTDVFRTDESSLTGSREMPHLTYQEIATGEGVSPTYVPFRNGNLLALATSIAMVGGAESVYFGAHAEDARGWAYPDCTPEFIGSMANAIFVGTYYKVRLVTPLEWAMKKDIAIRGEGLEVPWELTHSCYEGMRPACGKCPTCVERLQAFGMLGRPDPIEYVDPSDRMKVLR